MEWLARLLEKVLVALAAYFDGMRDERMRHRVEKAERDLRDSEEREARFREAASLSRDELRRRVRDLQ